MTNLTFNELSHLFEKNEFSAIENDARGIRFLKLRSMSRKAPMEEFAAIHNIDLSELKTKDYFQKVFENNSINNTDINKFINEKYLEERSERLKDQDYLIDQLSRLKEFDWGGSFGNSLEKNIVNNYVKKIKSYDLINEEIEGRLLGSLRGYTMSSWYNHWSSILIEDIFKDHEIVLPTVGLVKKIDFFINDIPFDLKVTYFPEQLLEDKLKQKGFGVELTRLKQECRKLKIFIPDDLNKRALKLHLYNKLSEDQRPAAKSFISELDSLKRSIIREAESNPTELKKWLYENQGEARFDASNRLFLILTDENNMADSWKLKRNIVYLKERIQEHLDGFSVNEEEINTEFYWAPDKKTYKCKSDIIFVKYTE